VVYVESENTILLTGYSSYSKYWFNPSSEVARVLDRAVINEYRVVSRVLPVSFRVVVSELPRLLEELKPRIALGLGLDPRARQVQVELAAVNYVYSEVSDVEGSSSGISPHTTINCELNAR
jgi:pyroglutamyl-peptidase